MRLRKDTAGGFTKVPDHAVEHPIFTGATPVGIMSADSPRFPSAPGGHDALKLNLASQGLRYEETEGRYGTPERSLIIHGPSREQMFHLGKQFGQESVIHSQNGQHQLLYTNGDQEGKHHPSIGSYDYWHPGDELPEDYYTKLPNQGAFRLHFDFNRLLNQPMAMPSPVAAPTAPVAAPITKYEIGHKLYTRLSKLVKAYEVTQDAADSTPESERPPVASASFPWLPHPHAYDWHDGHTDHNFIDHTSGGVLVQTQGALAKSGHAIPAFGSNSDEPTSLNHYDYAASAPLVDRMLADHGYQQYSGRTDHGRKNYNTKHLHIQLTGDPNTDAYRKVHELAHALTHAEVNSTYGEGKRQGKLGEHRSLKEALRAVHWEHLATHKHRELNKQLGINVPEETFNKEKNTVLHDAVHRVIHGSTPDLSAQNFKPHKHHVPLETALSVVREAARNIGLQGDHDLLKKSDLNLNVQEQLSVSNKKDLSVDEALFYLHEGLQKRIQDFAQSALELRKRETEALSKADAGKKLVIDTFHGSSKHLGDSVQPAGAGKSPRRDASVVKDEMADQGPRDPGSGGDDMTMKEKKMKKMLPGELSKDPSPGSSAAPPAPAPPSPGPGMPGKQGGPMLPGELAKHEYTCKCEGCSKMEKYAKGEATPSSKRFGKKRVPGCECTSSFTCGKCLSASAQNTPAVHGTPAKKSQPNTFVDNSKGDGKMPPKEGGKLVAGDSESGSDGTDVSKGKKIAKAGMPMAGGAGAMPAAPKPKLAGAAIPPPPPGMKPMKLPGVAKPAIAPKPPAMGAGTPSPVAKAALEKAGPVTLGPRSMQARKNFGARTQQEQAIKLPGVQASAGRLMDQMLASPGKAAPQAPGKILPMTSPAPQLAGVGQPIAKPAQGVQTMAERVASRMPAGPSAFTAPPPQAKPKLPGTFGKPTDPGVPALGALAAAHTAKPKQPVQTMVERVASNMPTIAPVKGEPSAKKLIGEARGQMTKSELIKNELGSCALCRKTEHPGRCQ